MKAMLKEFFTSKKAVMTVLGIIAFLAGKIGWDLNPEDLWPIYAAIAGYVLGQGFADMGKSAAKIASGDLPAVLESKMAAAKEIAKNPPSP